jgi:hypothetical protein
MVLSRPRSRQSERVCVSNFLTRSGRIYLAVNEPATHTFRMLISKQKLHEMLGAYVLTTYGLPDDLPAVVDLLSITSDGGEIQQVRVEVRINEDEV